MIGISVTVANTIAKIFEPSVLDTVIVAEPGETAVTRPFDTVTDAGLLEDHVIAALLAFDGDIVADNCMVCNGVKLTVLELNIIPDTRMGGLRI
jgi:hypothetical protein